MQYRTRNYSVTSSFLFDTLEELRYKDIVRHYFTKTLDESDPPLSNFEIYDALVNLSQFMSEVGFLVFKIHSRHQVCVYRWSDQAKPIINVIINRQNVEK